MLILVVVGLALALALLWAGLRRLRRGQSSGCLLVAVGFALLAVALAVASRLT
jgi:hypothetical protein